MWQASNVGRDGCLKGHMELHVQAECTPSLGDDPNYHDSLAALLLLQMLLIMVVMTLMRMRVVAKLPQGEWHGRNAGRTPVSGDSSRRECVTHVQVLLLGCCVRVLTCQGRRRGSGKSSLPPKATLQPETHSCHIHTRGMSQVPSSRQV